MVFALRRKVANLPFVRGANPRFCLLGLLAGVNLPIFSGQIGETAKFRVGRER
ncbi:hypothetical protein [uncultured Campylobacter sp.]|uniref:hypothetical protein n=1 Tax=uncultured Campylobacter sp. TaxID=218934 RepID=UPI003211B525